MSRIPLSCLAIWCSVLNLVVVTLTSTPNTIPADVAEGWRLPVFPRHVPASMKYPRPPPEIYLSQDTIPKDILNDPTAGEYFLLREQENRLRYNNSVPSAIAASSGKFIPRYLWVAVRSISPNETMNYQMPELFRRNRNWQVHVWGNKEKDAFMNEVFNGTSLLWAYNMIAPWAGAAKADIWRYAVLWLYGGAYVDDDSDLRTPLDKIVEPLDSLIVSYERNGFNADGCFIPRYKLSNAYVTKLEAKALERLKGKSVSSPGVPGATNSATEKPPALTFLSAFNGRVIPNWCLISAPRHPIIEQVMRNIVEIIAREYLRDPVMRDLHFAPKWSIIMCSTGPSMFTGSAREVVIEHQLRKLGLSDIKSNQSGIRTVEPIGLASDGVDAITSSSTAGAVSGASAATGMSKSGEISYKLAREDWRDYGGKFKAVYIPVRQSKDHYMNQKSLPYLVSYATEKPLTQDQIISWQGEAIQGQNAKEIFVIDQGKRRSIPNFDTFIALNFTMSDVRVITDDKVNQIPKGDSMPNLSK